MAEPTRHDTYASASEPLDATIDSLADGRSPEHTTLLRAVTHVAVGGAACGALAGFTLLTTLVVFTPGAPIIGAIPVGVLLGGTFGAATGALLAPTLGFWLFRDIPLWRLYAYSTVGTVVGGLLAALVRSDWIVGAFVGLAAGLALVRLRARLGD
jgi:hypothetical protein